MARALNKWEKEEREREREAAAKAEEKRRQKFVDSWTKATPEEQADILFKIMRTAETARSTAAHANFHHIRF